MNLTALHQSIFQQVDTFSLNPTMSYELQLLLVQEKNLFLLNLQSHWLQFYQIMISFREIFQTF